MLVAFYEEAGISQLSKTPQYPSKCMIGYAGMAGSYQHKMVIALTFKVRGRELFRLEKVNLKFSRMAAEDQSTAQVGEIIVSIRKSIW